VFQPPDGMAFFGPVISRIPDDACHCPGRPAHAGHP
jgi:hypothetical protein